MLRKLTSRKFLLALAVILIKIVESATGISVEILPWEIVAPIIAYIFGEAGVDIIRQFIEYKQKKE